MRFLPVGRSAVLIEVDDLEAVLRLHGALRESPPGGVLDIVPAARTVLLVGDGSVSRARLAEHVRGLAPRPPTDSRRDVVEIPVVYDGDDLAAVADRTGLSQEEVVARHRAGDYQVAFTGFAPGFAYLVGGDPKLRVPRRDTPRTRVPAGSVALADEFTGVYPREAPGGWQLIGHTDLKLWDLAHDPPALLAPGTRARFVAPRQ